MRAALLVAAIALLASACGGGGGSTPLEEPASLPAPKPKVVPPSHHEAAGYVKTCRQALARTKLVALTTKQAVRVKKEVDQAVTDCNHSDQLDALVNLDRADPSVYGAYLGEIAVFYGLQNYQKYVKIVASGKRGPMNVLLLAREQIHSGRVYLDASVTELKYPP